MLYPLSYGAKPCSFSGRKDTATPNYYPNVGEKISKIFFCYAHVGSKMNKVVQFFRFFVA
jgi:hypothetical protein